MVETWKQYHAHEWSHDDYPSGYVTRGRESLKYETFNPSVSSDFNFTRYFKTSSILHPVIPLCFTHNPPVIDDSLPIFPKHLLHYQQFMTFYSCSLGESVYSPVSSVSLVTNCGDFAP